MKLDSGEGVPLYLQIMDRVKRQILSGRYRAGDRLPSVRELALELRVNPNTVARAYSLLQEQGVLEGRQGGGSFVTQPDARARRLSLRLVESELKQAIESARKFHFSTTEIRELFETILNETGHHKE